MAWQKHGKSYNIASDLAVGLSNVMTRIGQTFHASVVHPNSCQNRLDQVLVAPYSTSFRKDSIAAGSAALKPLFSAYNGLGDPTEAQLLLLCISLSAQNCFGSEGSFELTQRYWSLCPSIYISQDWSVPRLGVQWCRLADIVATFLFRPSRHFLYDPFGFVYYCLR